jgi:hypothetical protein
MTHFDTFRRNLHNHFSLQNFFKRVKQKTRAKARVQLNNSLIFSALAHL